MSLECRLLGICIVLGSGVGYGCKPQLQSSLSKPRSIVVRSVVASGPDANPAGMYSLSIRMPARQDHNIIASDISGRKLFERSPYQLGYDRPLLNGKAVANQKEAVLRALDLLSNAGKFDLDVRVVRLFAVGKRTPFDVIVKLESAKEFRHFVFKVGDSQVTLAHESRGAIESHQIRAIAQALSSMACSSNEGQQDFKLTPTVASDGIVKVSIITTQGHRSARSLYTYRGEGAQVESDERVIGRYSGCRAAGRVIEMSLVPHLRDTDPRLKSLRVSTSRHESGYSIVVSSSGTDSAIEVHQEIDFSGQPLSDPIFTH